MQPYRVERLKAAVTVRLDDRLEMSGHLFVSPEPGDASTIEKVKALFLDAQNFLPLEVEGGVTVVQNKDRILWCRYEGPVGPVLEVMTPRRRITAILSDGSTVTGDLVADGPPDRRRVLDCLNRAERFLLIEAREGDYILRKDAITFVPSSEEGDPREDESTFEVGDPEEMAVGG